MGLPTAFFVSVQSSGDAQFSGDIGKRLGKKNPNLGDLTDILLKEFDDFTTEAEFLRFYQKQGEEYVPFGKKQGEEKWDRELPLVFEGDTLVLHVAFSTGDVIKDKKVFVFRAD